MSHPYYFIHQLAAEETIVNSIQDPLKYRITPTQTLALLGYYSNRSDYSIAQEIIGEIPHPEANDSILWNTYHKSDIRDQYKLYRPTTVKLTTGACINADNPWLVSTPDDFTWTDGQIGQNLYKAPFSQSLPRSSNVAHEIQIAHMMAVTQWTIPSLDYVVWTPNSSLIKVYTEDTLVFQTPGMTIRKLWETLIFPRLEEFHRTTLFPLMIKKGLNLERIYSTSSKQYLPIFEQLQSPERLVELSL